MALFSLEGLYFLLSVGEFGFFLFHSIFLRTTSSLFLSVHSLAAETTWVYALWLRGRACLLSESRWRLRVSFLFPVQPSPQAITSGSVAKLIRKKSWQLLPPKQFSWGLMSKLQAIKIGQEVYKDNHCNKYNAMLSDSLQNELQSQEPTEQQPNFTVWPVDETSTFYTFHVF